MSQPSIESFIEQQRKTGQTDEQITMTLLQNGWSLKQINEILLAKVPTPPVAVVNNMTAQTSNAGTPFQVENVQYNMKMKPVQSKIGLYIKITGVGLWLTVLFICSFISALIQRANGSQTDLGAALVLTLSLGIVTTPITVIAYRKFRDEERKNSNTDDDIFFKQSVRRGLWAGIVFGAIAAVVTLYQILSKAFLTNGSGSYAAGFSSLVYTIGLGGIVFFYWRLHAKTKR